MAYATVNDGSAHFQATKYTGNGSAAHAITNTGNANLQPDWVWIKCRSNAFDHAAWDSTRGASSRILPNTTAAAESQTNFASFNSDGFSVNTGDIVNTNSYDYVAWQWKANGGTEVTNNDGTVTTYVQLNSTAGFSIVRWTGNGNTSGTIGHGLGAIPDMIIRRDYSVVTNWAVAFPKQETSQLMVLNTNAAFGAASGMSGYTSTVFTDGSGSDSSSSIAYCYKNIKGYSKFGKYTGNGDGDGTFIYTGFKPSWLMIKRTDSANSWYLIDSTRDPFNVALAELEANTSGVEATGNNRLDILSNGFKIRTSGSAYNASGGTYAYAALAQNPFVATNDIIALAR
jgi:hypothetical protein